VTLVFFLLPLMFWGGLDHASSTPKWALLSIALPLLLMLNRPRWNQTHILGVGLLVLVWISTLWGPPIDSLERAWRFTVLGLAYALGTSLTDRQYRFIVYALCAGLLINLPVLVFQLSGWDFLPATDDPGALFLNGTFLSDAIAIGLIAFVSMHFSWALVVLGALVIVLAGGKAGILAIALCGALYAAKRQFWATGGILVMGLLLGAVAFEYTNSLQVRFPLWVNSMALIELFGQGAGSFPSIYPTVHEFFIATDPGIFSATVRPQTAHNDLVTVGVEFGAVGLALYVSVVAASLLAPVHSKEDRSAHYGLWAFVILGLVNFPLFMPLAVVPALMAGFLSRHWAGVRILDYPWGVGFRPSPEVGG